MDFNLPTQLVGPAFLKGLLMRSASIPERIVRRDEPSHELLNLLILLWRRV